MRARIVRALRPLHAMAVENRVQPGTPDVEFIGGWVELKSVSAWPRLGGPVRVGHFTTVQRLWLRKRCEKGGTAWLLLRVGKSWLLFDGATGAAIVGTATQAELTARARRYWLNTPTDSELLMTFKEERC